MFLVFIHVVVHVLFWLPLYTESRLPIHQRVDVWVVRYASRLSWMMPLWTVVYKWLCGHTFSFLLVMYLLLELLGNVIILGFMCEELPNNLPKWLQHFTCSAAMYEDSSFFTSFPRFVTSFFIITILVSVKLYLIVVLICIYVMANNAEYLFMCSLVLCKILDKDIFKKFSEIIIILLLLHFNFSFYILNRSPLSNIWFEKMNSNYASYLPNFLMISFATHFSLFP